MKRDMDLVRLLLLQIEGEENIDLSSFTEQEQLYHLVLMEEAGMIVAQFVEGDNGIPEAARVERLTMAGHDFISSARNSAIWQKAKEYILKPGAAWTLSLLAEYLKAQAAQAWTGLTGDHSTH